MAALTDAVNPYAALVGSAPAKGIARYRPTLASRASRLGARIVDIALIFVALFAGAAVAALMDLALGHSSAGDLAFGIVVLSFLALNLYQWFLLARDGQTLGKKAMGIKVVMYNDWSNPGFGRAVVLRNWVNGLIAVVPFYGLLDLLLIFGEDRRCIHDHIAGTQVIEVS